MHLVVTIDTEEDNWGQYSEDSFSIENIKKIPALQKIFDEFSVVPTYLVTYPVATDRESIKILKDILQQGKCEIGMHCHPWSTPPFDDERNSFNSMLSNLPFDLQCKKMGVLHEAIERNFGVTAKSFRAGRWGYNGHTALVLKKLGYRVDTSITPFTDWSEYHGPDFSEMKPESYRFNAPEIFNSIPEGEMAEIPATIGYLQNYYELCNSTDRLLSSPLGRLFRMKGLLNRAGLLNKVLLSPEGSDSGDMVRLTKVLMRKKFEIVNLFFHSTSLQAGLSIFVKTKEDEGRFSDRIRGYLAFTSEAGISPITLSDAADVV
ncbi:MAG TPA: polysaccharide deacetylase family protein [Syntrophales bacterium]|jgi:hypothetical protein|nr:polysaccharide deacetylase family protein [Syntrophales bacterium]